LTKKQTAITEFFPNNATESTNTDILESPLPKKDQNTPTTIPNGKTSPPVKCSVDSK
jgi:hypothetical protein